MNRIISYFRVTFFFIVTLSSVSTQAAEKQVEKEMVIAQMNNCVNTLTNIINSKSMTVLEHETDQLLNNLTIEQIVGLYEIADFREELIDAIGKLGITEEERNLLKRINSINQDNLKWQAFSSALSNTMMITGGGNSSLQAGFQALVTVARTAVEFKVVENEQQIGELQAMWELRKSDLNTFVSLRKQALSIIFSLYQKYNLKESDRLTEQTSQLFQKIISDSDPQRMVRLLDDNFNKFGHIADYYYYLGMGYIDMNNIPKAMSAFANYERLYSQAPIYRINEKSGLISLVKLAYLTNLSKVEIEKELNNALINLSNNTMAYIQCAMVYDKVLNNPNKALSILRSALDNMMTSDKAAIITAASTFMSKISKDEEYKEFITAYKSQRNVDMNAVLNMCIATEYNIFDFLSENLEFSNLYKRVLFIGPKKIGDNITLTHSRAYSLDLSNVDMFVEQHKNDEITVSKYIIQDKTAVTLEEIEKIDAFKSNPNLKYLYMWSCGENLFQIKDGIDYKAITNETFPGQSEFTLNEKDIKKIVKFLKKHHKKSVKTELIAKKYITAAEKKKEIGINAAVADLSAGSELIGYHTVKYIANNPDATFVKFVFNNDIRNIIVCYQWDKENNRLEPYCTEYQGETYLVGASNEIVTLEEETKTNNKKSWWRRLWNSDDDKKVKTELQKSEDSKKKSWWRRLWNSNNEIEKDENTAEQKKGQPEIDTNKEKSWWNIFRRSDKAKDVKKE